MKFWTWAGAVLGLAAIAAAGTILVPRGLAAADFLRTPDDLAAVAHYAISATSAPEYEAEISRAIAARDEDLAQSLADLAASQGVALPPPVTAAIAQAKADAAARRWSDAWEGFVSGDTPNGAAFAGALTADLTGYGDLRDLYGQAMRYRDGLEVDGFTIGMAAAGLALTAATVATLGSTSPERGGLSLLKAARRGGRLSPALLRETGALAASAVDRRALGTLAASLSKFEFGAARKAAAEVVRPEAVARIGALGSDVAEIGSTLGYRGALQTLGVTKSASEVKSVRTLARSFGARTRGLLALTGGAVLTGASFLLSATAWAVSAALWLMLCGLFVLRLAWKAARWLWPRRTVIARPA